MLNRLLQSNKVRETTFYSKQRQFQDFKCIFNLKNKREFMKTVADSVNKTRKTFGLDAKKRVQEGIF